MADAGFIVLMDSILDLRDRVFSQRRFPSNQAMVAIAEAVRFFHFPLVKSGN